MNYEFNRDWTTEEIRSMVQKNSYLKFGEHENLKALVCLPYAEDEVIPNYYELIFIVPAKWLENKVKELYSVNDLDQWLQNEYTSDESETLFCVALQERQIVMVNFD